MTVIEIHLIQEGLNYTLNFIEGNATYLSSIVFATNDLYDITDLNLSRIG